MSSLFSILHSPRRTAKTFTIWVSVIRRIVTTWWTAIGGESTCSGIVCFNCVFVQLDSNTGKFQLQGFDSTHNNFVRSQTTHRFDIHIKVCRLCIVVKWSFWSGASSHSQFADLGHSASASSSYQKSVCFNLFQGSYWTDRRTWRPFGVFLGYTLLGDTCETKLLVFSQFANQRSPVAGSRITGSPNLEPLWNLAKSSEYTFMVLSESHLAANSNFTEQLGQYWSHVQSPRVWQVFYAFTIERGIKPKRCESKLICQHRRIDVDFNQIYRQCWNFRKHGSPQWVCHRKDPRHAKWSPHGLVPSVWWSHEGQIPRCQLPWL